jgi:hypothetical protein
MKKREFHGCSANALRTVEYRVWERMRQRCGNPNAHNYKNYGGRGIECRFEHFADFIAEVGPRPSARHSIGRINNDGHYEAGNVRWETRTEQNRNTRWNALTDELVAKIKLLRESGMMVKDIATATGVKYGTVQNALYGKNWNNAEALRAELAAAQQEIADLRHDIEQYVKRDSEQLQEIALLKECVVAADKMREYWEGNSPGFQLIRSSAIQARRRA